MVAIGPYKDVHGNELGQLAVLKLDDKEIIAYDAGLIISTDRIHKFDDKPRTYYVSMKAAKENSLLIKMLQKAEVLPLDDRNDLKKTIDDEMNRVLEPSHN
jgi:hypothetical protein